MADREKVLIGLTCCGNLDSLSDKICERCPYNHDKIGYSGCEDRLVADALALIKALEPRVLEYPEIEKHPLVWLEDNDKEDVIPALFLQYNGWNAEFSRKAPDKYVDAIVRSAKVVAVERTYGITWRAWTARPTDEQRKAVKWDG